MVGESRKGVKVIKHPLKIVLKFRTTASKSYAIQEERKRFIRFLLDAVRAAGLQARIVGTTNPAIEVEPNE